MAPPKEELRALLRAAREPGWDVRLCKSGHQLRAPDGVHIVTVHATPSPRATRNCIADLRKFGFEWKGR